MTPEEAVAQLFASREKLRFIAGFVAEQGQPDEEDLLLASEAISEALAALDVLLQG